MRRVKYLFTAEVRERRNTADLRTRHTSLQYSTYPSLDRLRVRLSALGYSRLLLPLISHHSTHEVILLSRADEDVPRDRHSTLDRQPPAHNGNVSQHV